MRPQYIGKFLKDNYVNTEVLNLLYRMFCDIVARLYEDVIQVIWSKNS